MDWLEWIVWTILLWFTSVCFITWLVKKRKYRGGFFYDTREVVALYTIPRVVLTWSVILIVFLFVDVNKLHLIWICPLVYIFINLRMSKKVLREDEERLMKESSE